MDVILAILSEYLFLLPNHLIYKIQGKKFELKSLKARDYFLSLLFWALVLLYFFFSEGASHP